LEIQIKSKEIEKEYFANGPLGRMALVCHSQRAGFSWAGGPFAPKTGEACSKAAPMAVMVGCFQ
jgi:hypothetical protein